MERRIYYAARPHEVLTGFLTFVLTAGLLGLLIYGMFHARTGGAVVGLVKLLPFALAAAGTMLFRERVIADGRERSLEVQRSFFLVPLSRRRYHFSDVRAARWKPRPQGQQAQLVLELPDGGECVLSRAARPDAAQSREVRAFLGLPENPSHDELPPVPPPSGTIVSGRAVAIGFGLLIVFVGALIYFS